MPPEAYCRNKVSKVRIIQSGNLFSAKTHLNVRKVKSTRLTRLSAGLAASLLLVNPFCFALGSQAASSQAAGKQEKVAVSVPQGGSRYNEAKALAEQVLTALGGYENFKSFNDKPCLATGKIVQTSGLSGVANSFDCEMVIKREKEKITIKFLGQPLTTVYDGKVCWTQQGDAVMPSDAITAKRIEDDITHGMLLLEAVRNPSTRMEIGKPTVIDGKACDTLLVWAPDGEPTTFAVDKQNHLVLASSYMGVDLEQGNKIEKVYHYDDYKIIEGCNQPFKVLEYSGDKKVSETIISKVSVDDSITDAFFTMPKETLPTRLTAGAVTIPFEYASNEILVKAKVNGGAEMKFILDTGATQSILDASSLKQLNPSLLNNLDLTGGVALTTGAGSIQAGSINAKSLSFGDLEITNIPFAVAQLDSFDQVTKEHPAGLIGANILKRFLVTVDYEHRKLIFEDPNKSSVPEGAIVVNTKPSLGMSGLAVEGTLDGKQNLSFLIDTGAAFNNISESKVKHLIPNPLYRIGQLKGLDGKAVETGSARFDSLNIDKLHIDKPIFSIAPVNGPNQGPGGIITSSDLAIIGNPLLSHYKVTFDYRNQRLFLSQSPAQKTFYDYQNKIQGLRMELLRTKNVNQIIRDLTSMADSAHNKDMPAAEAMARIELAMALCQKKGGSFAPDMLFKPISSAVLMSESNNDDLKASPQKAPAADSKKKGDEAAGQKTSQESIDALLADSEAELLRAFNLSERCPDKSVQARVLAAWGFLYCSQNPSLGYLASAKQKISKAVALAPTDPEVLASSGYFLSRLESTRPNSAKSKQTTKMHESGKSEKRTTGNTNKKDNASSESANKEESTEKEDSGKGDSGKIENAAKSSREGAAMKTITVGKGSRRTVIRNLDDLGKWLVDQIVDQSIMIDPANWLALWTKLERVRAQGNSEEARVIQAQIKHYYPQVNITAYLK